MASYIGNILGEAKNNNFYRHVLSTTENSQLVVMSVAPKDELGEEVHDKTTQIIFIAEGASLVYINGRPSSLFTGGCVVIPPGTKHNVINQSDRFPLKIFTVYSPPHHAPGLIQAQRS